MLVAYHVCDHCNKTLDEMKDYISISDLSYLVFRNMDQIIPEIDLCEECFEELCGIIKDYVHSNV